jgi:hypothetical protein
MILPAMESTTEQAIDMASHPGASTPMEEMSTPLHTLKTTKDLSSEYMNKSMYTKSDVILQFINNNCPGSPP